jgi:hypothetical protein
VTRIQTESCEVVTGVWEDGRIGILHGLRTGPSFHKVTVYGTKAVTEQKMEPHDYSPLVREIVKFFHSHPTAPYESGFELESKRGGGRRCVIGR